MVNGLFGYPIWNGMIVKMSYIKWDWVHINLQKMDTEGNVICKKRGGEYEFIIDQTSCTVYHEADMILESSMKKIQDNCKFLWHNS